jgi:hypothetical protein
LSSVVIFCRLIIFAFGGGGIACSVLGTLSCEFFSIQIVDDSDLPDPWAGLDQASVGMFAYSASNNKQDEECIDYEDNFWNSSVFNEFFVSAQLCAILAPSFGFLAWLHSLVEAFSCSCFCSCASTAILFALALVAQGGTFMIYGQTGFW